MTSRERIEQNDRANFEAARAILENVDYYGGPGAGLVVWARTIIEARATQENDFGNTAQFESRLS
jgi:hypothetical protein